ncbi:MAG: hypothetical protein M1826_004881 [Phylliscum demangeonii]|nr:MAG: hypothetical protein M1826_004881 [Phylliscum demangeonii]
MRTDPRIRQTWNNISHNLESANESAQVNLFTLTQNYLWPCFGAIGGCVEACTAPCFPRRDDRPRLRRGSRGGRARGSRGEYDFDFYDDWESNEDYDGARGRGRGATDGLLGLGNDELDRLLAGSGSGSGARQPGRKRAMSYGARRERDRDQDGRLPGGRRRAGAVSSALDSGQDLPTVIGKSSLLWGFFGRLPRWDLGRKPVKYSPSVADLQDRSVLSPARADDAEAEPLLDREDEGCVDGPGSRRQGARRGRRPRSSTASSGSASDSIRSRADLFPSEDEDDAIPLDDEFAMALERRTSAAAGRDDPRGGKTRKTGAPSSQTSTTTHASHPHLRSSETEKEHHRRGSASTGTPSEALNGDGNGHGGGGGGEGGGGPEAIVASLAELKIEEDAVQREEEEDLERKRAAAIRLAAERGLADQGPLSPSPLASPGDKQSATDLLDHPTESRAPEDVRHHVAHPHHGVDRE